MHADNCTTCVHAHGHDHPRGLRGAIREIFAPHSHDAADSVDDALQSSAAGIRAVKISLVVLGVTAIAQIVVMIFSGSVALAADTIHNFSDALTAAPLWIAFALGTKAATRRYTYGFGRAEDLAGLFVVAVIALSAIVAGYQAVVRLTESESGAASALPPWLPTGCTLAPTGSPPWRCCSPPVVSRSGSHWPTPSSVW
jgi:Co/Zn/Cd efflux system component